MLKMLVVEDNSMQCKQLVNFLSSSNLEIKLYNMCFSGNEALQIIENEHIDIIFLDLNLPDISGMDILNFIENNQLEEYKNSIIVVSSNIYLYPKLICNPYIYSLIDKPINFEILYKNVKDLIDRKKDLDNELSIKSNIRKELEFLRV